MWCLHHLERKRVSPFCIANIVISQIWGHKYRKCTSRTDTKLITIFQSLLSSSNFQSFKDLSTVVLSMTIQYLTSQKGYNPWKVLYGYKMYISTFQKIKGLLIENERSCQPFILTNALLAFYSYESPFIHIKALLFLLKPFILIKALLFLLKPFILIKALLFLC